MLGAPWRDNRQGQRETLASCAKDDAGAKFSEGREGILKPVFLADIAIMGRNRLEPPEELAEPGVATTLCDGVVIHRECARHHGADILQIMPIFSRDSHLKPLKFNPAFKRCEIAWRQVLTASGDQMKNRIISAISALFLSAGALWANPIVPVELAPVTHIDATLVVVGADGTEITYTPAQLEELPTYSLTTRTPWRDKPATFEGVLLKDILATNGIDGANAISVVAENDYATVVPREVWANLDILVATRVNGRPHTRRARGPIQFVIDMDAYTASDVTSESNLVWMAARIEAES